MYIFQLIGEYVWTIFLYILLFLWFYWFIISFFGIGTPKRRAKNIPQKKFLLLIPAHNEEAVIGNLVKNLRQLEYPSHLYDIVVIADNCSDLTAEISRTAGAKVIEHFSEPEEPRGKPYALRYAFDLIGNNLEKYDAFCVFDADNLVSLNYLQEMNNHLCSGDQVIQCYLDTKNPTDNWLTLSYATSYYYMNRSWQLAKERLRLGNAIGGTGFCVTIDVLKKIGWKATSLTEDLEFQMECLLHGIKPRWAHFAKVYDEKPTGFKASCIQRLRWARGHWDVCFKYVHKLLWRSIIKRDLAAFDGALYLLNPAKICAEALTFLAVTILAVSSIIPMWLWITCLIIQAIYILYCLKTDTKQIGKKIFGVLYLPVFNFIYIPLFVYALITKKE